MLEVLTWIVVGAIVGKLYARYAEPKSRSSWRVILAASAAGAFGGGLSDLAGSYRTVLAGHDIANAVTAAIFAMAVAVMHAVVTKHNAGDPQ